MKIVVVASQKEWQTYRQPITEYAEKHGCAAPTLLSDGGELDAGGVRVLFLSIYQPSAALAVYRSGIRDVGVFHRDGYFAFEPDEPALAEREKAYLENRAYDKLKQLNRVRMLLCYFHRETVLTSLPLDLQIESTGYCNARCIMCGHYVYGNAIAKHMPPGLPKRLEKYLMYAENVILHGNGEPFLQPDIGDIIRYYGSFGVRMATNTNLSVLNGEILRCLKQYFSEITVSIDGCTREIYENIRLNLRFDRLMENLALLNREAPQLRKKIAVVACRQNLHQLPDFIPFAAEHGFQAVNYIAMGSSQIADNRHDEIENYPETASLQLKKAMELAKRYGVGIELPYHLLRDGACDEQRLQQELAEIESRPMFRGRKFGDRLFETYVRPRLDALAGTDGEVMYSDYTASPLDAGALSPDASLRCTGVCDSVFMRPYIMLEGKLATCCLRPKSYLGNVLEQELSELWNSEPIRKMRAMFYQNEVPSYCRGCSFMNNGFLQFGEFNDE